MKKITFDEAIIRIEEALNAINQNNNRQEFLAKESMPGIAEVAKNESTHYYAETN